MRVQFWGLAVRSPSPDRARLVTEGTPRASRSGRQEKPLSLLIAELADTHWGKS